MLPGGLLPKSVSAEAVKMQEVRSGGEPPVNAPAWERPDTPPRRLARLAAEGERRLLGRSVTPADQLLDVVGHRRAEGLDAHLGPASAVGTPQPVPFLQLADGRLGPALPQPDAALGMRGGEVGAHPIGQPAVVRSG